MSFQTFKASFLVAIGATAILFNMAHAQGFGDGGGFSGGGGLPGGLTAPPKTTLPPNSGANDRFQDPTRPVLPDPGDPTIPDFQHPGINEHVRTAPWAELTTKNPFPDSTVYGGIDYGNVVIEEFLRQFGEDGNQPLPDRPTSPVEMPASPGAGTGTFGGVTLPGAVPTAAEAWTLDVQEAEQDRETTGSTTCDGAINALYRMACSGASSCNLEYAYERRCVRPGLSDSEYTECLTAEQVYVNACFTSETPPIPLNLSEVSAGHLSGISSQLCNAAAFRVGADIYAATADHCLLNDKFYSSLHGDPEVAHDYFELSRLSNPPPLQVSGDFAFLDVPEDARVKLERLDILGVAEPELYAPTVFVAVNAISRLRSEMAALNVRPLDTGQWWRMDQSRFCTVVSYDIDTGEILHTCQSSRGSSGGALIQIRNGLPVLVGIHVGHWEDNPNLANVAQFAAASEFQ